MEGNLYERVMLAHLCESLYFKGFRDGGCLRSSESSGAMIRTNKVSVLSG